MPYSFPILLTIEYAIAWRRVYILPRGNTALALPFNRSLVSFMAHSMKAYCRQLHRGQENCPFRHASCFELPVGLWKHFANMHLPPSAQHTSFANMLSVFSFCASAPVAFRRMNGNFLRGSWAPCRGCLRPVAREGSLRGHHPIVQKPLHSLQSICLHSWEQRISLMPNGEKTTCRCRRECAISGLPSRLSHRSSEAVLPNHRLYA